MPTICDTQLLEQEFWRRERMQKYRVQKPFMARKGQFGPDHELCIGIEKSALTEAGEYRCYIGKNDQDFYDITLSKAMAAVADYGEKNVIWHIRGKDVFILPIKIFDHGKTEPMLN